jgi:hypothetical protein
MSCNAVQFGINLPTFRMIPVPQPEGGDFFFYMVKGPVADVTDAPQP